MRTEVLVTTLNFLHILFAAAWFGHKLLVPGDIRRSTGSGGVADASFLDRLTRAERLGITSGLGTVIFGSILAFEVGFDTVDFGVWIGMGLAFSAIGVGAIAGRPVAKRLRTAVANGHRTDAAAAGAQLTRILSAESLLWAGALAAMVI